MYIAHHLTPSREPIARLSIAVLAGLACSAALAMENDARGGGGVNWIMSETKKAQINSVEHTRVDNNKTNKPRPVAYAAPHPITPARKIGKFI